MVTRSWWAAEDIFGVVIQLEQSIVGKTFESAIMCPPMLASRSTSSTRCP